MLTELVKWAVEDLKTHRNPYVWILLTAIGGVLYTNYYATPAYVTAGIESRLTDIEYNAQLKYVRELRNKKSELEYRDRHNGQLPVYEVDELNEIKSILPEEEKKLERLEDQKIEIQGNGTGSGMWNVFSFRKAVAATTNS